VDGTESWALDTGSFAWLHYLDDRSKLSCDLNAAYSHRIAEFVRTYLISEPSCRWLCWSNWELAVIVPL